MFYFLLFTGAAMILFGMRGMQKERDLVRQQFFTTSEPDAKPAALASKEEDQEMITDLTDRMSEMERSLFEHLLKWQMEKEELLGKIDTEKTSSVESKMRVEDKKVEKENTEKITAKEKKIEKAVTEEKIETAEKNEAETSESKKKPMPDHIRKVMDYEKEGLSIQEIANITRMKKGEVLLLRNLSKHYKE